MKANYQLVLNKTLDELRAAGTRPRLLIHSCCAPCSSYCLDYLKKYFNIGVFYYNPNIYPEEEFAFRSKEQEELIEKMGLDADFIGTSHSPGDFYKIAKGLEREPERGARCISCYRLRLDQTALYAKEKSYDYFTTTLSLSPHKDAQVLNELGASLEEKHGVKYLYSDFKKKEGFKKSVQLTSQYDMYRQEYCGCIYSYQDFKKRQREEELDKTLK